LKRLLQALWFAALLPVDLARMVLVYLPGNSGILLRRHYYRRRLKRCGENFCVMPGVHLVGLDRIEIGDNVMIRENAIIRTGAPNRGVDERRSIRVLPGNRDCTPGTVVLSDNSRIAFGALILGQGGVHVGRDCGIGPGAVVLSETFHYQGIDADIAYKYSQGAAAEEQSLIQGAVVLEDGSGIASHVVLLPGTRLRRQAWAAPGSVLRIGGLVAEGVIVKGDPATPVFHRKDPASAGPAAE
jgi:acetyltransferase-like isoleucine patch superfamily enzyme